MTKASTTRPRTIIATATASVGLRKPLPGAKSVGSFIPRLTRHAFEKYGFSAATLITDWATIVGSDLARWTEPERLRWPKAVGSRTDVEDVDQGRPGATLVLRVDQGRALDIQYKTRQIIERINAYFGYRAVADLRIVQAPLTARLPEPARMTTAATRTPSVPPASLATVADDGLRSALERMASGLASRKLVAIARPRKS